jgi:hypothetical protein
MPNCNRKILVGKCREALLKHTRPLRNVVVIDKALNERTIEMTQERFGPPLPTCASMRTPLDRAASR